MFKKLISNLPFNPSLLGQVSFYSKRLKAEESIRRIGFVFMALAFFIQLFAVMAPAQKSLASSNDYIINGLSSRDDILRAWDGQSGDGSVQEIYSKFGLTRSVIARLSMYPNDHVITNQADYWSIGRQSLSATSRSASIKQTYKNSEIPINTGSTTVYVRPLKAWDIINPFNDYDAWHGTTDSGQQFWLLQDCGNFTTVGIPPITQAPAPAPAPTPVYTPAPAPVYTPVAPAPDVPAPAPVPIVYVPIVTVAALPTPALELRKTIDGGARAIKPGETFTYRFEYRNSVLNSAPAADVKLRDVLDLANYEVESSTLGVNATTMGAGNELTMAIGTVQYSPEYKLGLLLTVRMRSTVENGKAVCNTATLTSGNAGGASSGGNYLCVTAVVPCALDNSVASGSACTTPTLVCSLTQSAVNRTTKESTLTTKVTTTNAALTHVVSYVYNFGDSTSKTNNNNSLTDTVAHVYKDGKYTASATVNYTVGTDIKTARSINCGSEMQTLPDQPLALEKSVQNITQNLSKTATLTTKAKAGDIIEYTLTTHNSYSYDRSSYAISDAIGDVLEYTDIDPLNLASSGGSYDANTRTITWSNQTIKANSELTKQFRVTVKNPVPSTNKPGVMTTSYDCVISNVYGNETSVPINCPVVKTAEYVTTRMPDTGPGTGVMIGAVFMIVVAYFFARARLLGKEIELVRTEYAAGGGF